jgi:hypothetical protein
MVRTGDAAEGNRRIIQSGSGGRWYAKAKASTDTEASTWELAQLATLDQDLEPSWWSGPAILVERSWTRPVIGPLAEPRSHRLASSRVTVAPYCERMFDWRSEIPSRAASLSRCRLPFGIEGLPVFSISWAGTRFHAVVLLNREEIDRREAVGLGAVTDYSTLNSLATLPVDAEVPWASVDPVVAAFLDCLPAGVVSANASGVRSLLRPPLQLIALVKEASDWRSIGSIAPLGQDAPTVLLLRHRPRELHRAIDLAQSSGVGLGYLSGSAVFGVLEPRSTPRLSVRRMRLVEVVFQRWRNQTAGMPASLSQAFSCFEGG